MNRRNVREALELIVTASIITYSVMQCNKRISEYQYNNAQEYMKDQSVYKK